MNLAVRSYQQLMELADPRVKDWPFLRGPGPTIWITAAYLLLVYSIIPAFMKNRKPYDLTTIIQCYNVFQVISCASLFYWFLSAGWIQGEYSLGCQVVDYSDNPHAVKLVTGFYWLYWMKMSEMLETVFFALRKKFKQISLLHTYHHSSTFALAYICCKFNGGGMYTVHAMMNLLIHVFMYTYYYLSSLGPEWQKSLAPWKPRMTMAQLVQFILMLIHLSVVFKPSCPVPPFYFSLYGPNVLLLFKMFYDFYRNNYKKKRIEPKLD